MFSNYQEKRTSHFKVNKRKTRCFTCENDLFFTTDMNPEEIDFCKISDEMQFSSEEEQYNIDDTMAFFRNKSHSVEQIAVLISIWALKFENNCNNKAQAEATVQEYLKNVLLEADTEQCLELKIFNEILAAVKDCGLCKLMVYTKICMKNCTASMLNTWSNQIECPFRKTGVSYLAFKELKDDVIELHRKRCCCPCCAKFVIKYEGFMYEMSLHEQIHRARNDY